MSGYVYETPQDDANEGHIDAFESLHLDDCSGGYVDDLVEGWSKAVMAGLTLFFTFYLVVSKLGRAISSRIRRGQGQKIVDSDKR